MSCASCGLIVIETAEPTDSPVGRRVPSCCAGDASVEPETAALLSAADRAEHVATVIRPALERGEVVVCDRFVLTSLAVHGAARGADVERIRGVNAWSTDAMPPDLVLVVVDPDGASTRSAHATAQRGGDGPGPMRDLPGRGAGRLPAAVIEPAAASRRRAPRHARRRRGRGPANPRDNVPR